jgi:hypothetical protein
MRFAHILAGDSLRAPLLSGKYGSGDIGESCPDATVGTGVLPRVDRHAWSYVIVLLHLRFSQAPALSRSLARSLASARTRARALSVSHTHVWIHGERSSWTETPRRIADRSLNGAPDKMTRKAAVLRSEGPAAFSGVCSNKHKDTKLRNGNRKRALHVPSDTVRVTVVTVGVNHWT